MVTMRGVVDPASRIQAVRAIMVPSGPVSGTSAEARIAAAIAAGGRLVTDEYAPSFWVLADTEGNEACISTAGWTGPAR